LFRNDGTESHDRFKRRVARQLALTAKPAAISMPRDFSLQPSTGHQE